MDDSALRSPAVAAPEAPDWFRWALGVAPERTFVEAAGARIETLTWGKRGKPGLLFLHGNGAHADWWSFIAPFFAADYRVAALSWSGMGGSDRRDGYALDIFVEEALTVARETGLFDGPVKPVFIGHSFGSFPLVAAGVAHGDSLRLGIGIDMPIFVPERRSERKKAAHETRPNKIYPTLQDALARFRLEPAQPCDHPYILDHIARTSVTRVMASSGEEGWTWRFDPFLWQVYRSDDPVPMVGQVRCPLAMVVGEKSALFRESDLARFRGLLPPGSPLIEIPEAHHHVMVDQPLALVATLRALLAA